MSTFTDILNTDPELSRRLAVALLNNLDIQVLGEWQQAIEAGDDQTLESLADRLLDPDTKTAAFNPDQPRCPAGSGETSGEFSNSQFGNCNPQTSQLSNIGLDQREAKIKEILEGKVTTARRSRMEEELRLVDAERSRRSDPNQPEGDAAQGDPVGVTITEPNADAPSAEFIETLAGLDLPALDEVIDQLLASKGAGMSDAEKAAVLDRRRELVDDMEFAKLPIDPRMVKLPEGFKVEIDPLTGLPDQAQAENLAQWYFDREGIVQKSRSEAEGTDLATYMTPERLAAFEEAGIVIRPEYFKDVEGRPNRNALEQLSFIRHDNSGVNGVGGWVAPEVWEGLANAGHIPFATGYKLDEEAGNGALLNYNYRVWDAIAEFDTDLTGMAILNKMGAPGLRTASSSQAQNRLEEVLPDGYSLREAFNSIAAEAHAEVFPAPESIGDYEIPSPHHVDLEPSINMGSLATDDKLSKWMLGGSPTNVSSGLRSATKARISRDVAAEANRIDPEAGVDAEYVSEVLGSWANSSQKDETSSMLQAIMSGEDMFESSHGEFTQLDDSFEDLAKLSTTAQAIYNNTQAHLEAAGITEVEVTRGTSWSEGKYVTIDEIYNPVREMIKTGNTAMTLTAEWDRNPLTSWTTDQRIGDQFARKGNVSVQEVEWVGSMEVSAVQTVMVPREAVFSTARTGIGALHESEVVLLDVGGASDVVLKVSKFGENSQDVETRLKTLEEMREEELRYV